MSLPFLFVHRRATANEVERWIRFCERVPLAALRRKIETLTDFLFGEQQ
jgi:hypothetical protein